MCRYSRLTLYIPINFYLSHILTPLLSNYQYKPHNLHSVSGSIRRQPEHCCKLLYMPSTLKPTVNPRISLESAAKRASHISLSSCKGEQNKQLTLDVFFRCVRHSVSKQDGGIRATLGVSGVNPNSESQSRGQTAHHKDWCLARHVRLRGRNVYSVRLGCFCFEWINYCVC